MTQQLALDVADAGQAARFPKHGWARNSQGVKLLWMPILDLVRSPDERRQERGAPPLQLGEEKDNRALYETLRNVVVTLRELRHLVRDAEDIPIGTKDTAHWAREERLHELAPVYIDTVFMYFRRLADRMTTALRLVLFEKIDPVPRMSFANFRDFMTRTSQVEAAGPLFDVPKLQQAFAVRSFWFARIQRSATETRGKGIRDSRSTGQLE